MKKLQKGFTLIELLVVIGIIGILAALVLVALGNARTRANDARIKSNLGQMRVLAEVYYDNNDSSYAGFDTCVDTPSLANCGVQDTADAITTLNTDITGATPGGVAFEATSSAQAFCVSALLNTVAEHAQVDQTGAFTQTATGCDAT